jgi:hypothetical protein
MKVKGIISVLLAYPAAAAVGAALVVVEFGLLALTESGPSGIAELAAGWWVLPVAWVYAFPVFLVGLLFVGTPVWLLMAGLKRDSRTHALLTGAILSALAGFLIMQRFSGETALSGGPFIYAAALVIPGAAAGWTLHRVAYGR